MGKATYTINVNITLSTENRLSPIGAVIMSALTRLVTEEKDNPKLRGSCYVAVGKLGLKIPALVNKVVYSYLLVYFGFIIALTFFYRGFITALLRFSY